MMENELTCRVEAIEAQQPHELAVAERSRAPRYSVFGERQNPERIAGCLGVGGAG